MFKKTPSPEAIWLQAVKIQLLTAMNTHSDPASSEFAELMNQYVAIQGATAHQAQKPLDRNALLAVAANLAGIGLIVGHERLHVLTSKAIGFVTKATT